ncbi:MAG: TM0996/MTH895 family glutaredoxin-like protein [Candidatus Sumerlaeia bacterium]|nr:TM0996/MTH895 family glutaredoxin-like protein [Candidatus Sumerlaeia bacterium]
MKKLQVLGTGCPKCKRLTELTEQAARAVGIEFELEKVTDINRIVDFGVMTTPALVVDGEVKLAGRLPNAGELEAMLK